MSDYWDETKELLYDAVNNVFYTPEERQDKIDEALSNVSNGVDSDVGNIPPNFRPRSITFYSPIDLVLWIEDGGIPANYIYIHKFQSLRDNDVKYRAYVS